MTQFSRRAFFWAPRAMSIVFIAFLSMFALDVFGEGYGFWKTLLALTMHLIPSFVLIAALVLAWRWEWIGATLYAGAGSLYIYWALQRRLPPSIKLLWVLTIAGPAFLVAALFLANWLKRAEIRGKP
jgi:hypothetical protein